MVLLHLHARLQPLDRGEFFEDPLEEALRKSNLGEITGGGSLMDAEGEIKSCDVEIELQGAETGAEAENLPRLLEILQQLRLPKGSHLSFGEHIIPLGDQEGLALYLNGTSLPAEVYETTSIDELHEAITKLLGEEGRILSYWDGPEESAAYLYGNSFQGMHQLIEPFLSTYPLCQQCRVVQIA
ncbi:MAG: hypothetical protein NW208_03230 [Bryobacter sp.]|nr:hypothetical protein [Bryobacter sp.]